MCVVCFSAVGDASLWVQLAGNVVRDGEGKLLAMSGPGGFATSKDAEAAIDHLRAVIGKAKVNVKDGK